MRRLSILMGITAAVLLMGASAFSSVASPAAQGAQATPNPLGEGIDAQAFFFDVRADLEVLADAVFGEAQRPEGWTGNFDTQSGSFPPDVWYDTELAADAVLGEGVRTDTWQGVSISSAESLVRSVRQNLEVLANEQFGIGQRPNIWRGAPVRVLCDRTLLNTIALLELIYRYDVQTSESALNYCQTLQNEIDAELNRLVFSLPDQNGNVLDPIPLLGGARGDLERLADELFGLNTRPEGYIGNRDATTPTFLSELLLDINTLANSQLGEGVRPPGFIGEVSAAPGASYYNLRYDIELLTDVTLPDRIERPTGWQGTNPIERCVPAVNYLTFLINQAYQIQFTEIDPLAPDYCDQLTTAANAVVENPPILDEVVVEQRLTGSSNFAFSYLDVAALNYMGIMPGGTRFRAVYRNFGASNMMFVVGENFALYVDRRFTTVEETVFNSLPSMNDVNPITFCDAPWCNGPGPTPTPTGSTALELVLFGGEAVATPDTTQLETTKQLVSWNFVRVTYISDNPNTRSAQVTLEVCNGPAATSTACEPASFVFDNAVGAEKPVIGQQNGLNVYEFRYGYTTNVIIESANLYSTDVWISDPTIR